MGENRTMNNCCFFLAPSPAVESVWVECFQKLSNDTKPALLNSNWRVRALVKVVFS